MLRKKLTLMQWIGIFTIIAGLILVGLSSFVNPNAKATAEASAGKQIAGIVLILIAMIFTGLQVKKRKFCENKQNT